MNFKIHFDQSPEYVYIQTEGEASVSGFDALLTELVGSPRWETGAKQLVDHRKLILGELSPGDMQKIKNIVLKHSKKLGNGRCAFVISSSVGYGLARMYGLLGGEDIHEGVGVFYTIDEGVAWLKT